jgi:hypothetical protein
MSASYKFNRNLILVYPAAETWMPYIEANRRILAMSRKLKMAMVAAMLALTATGAAQARGDNFDRGGFGSVFDQPHYRYFGGFKSGPAYFVPGRGIVNEPCQMPTSACSMTSASPANGVIRE